MNILTKEGFVFIDGEKPYWCALYGNEPWLMYWHPDKRWVTLRSISNMEVMAFHEIKIPDSEALIYHKIHEENSIQCFPNNQNL